MSRWGVTLLLMLAVPFVFVGEIQSLCTFLDLQMDACGKFITLFFGCLCSVFVGIARHG